MIGVIILRKLFIVMVACLALIPALLTTASAKELSGVRWGTRNDAPVPYLRMVMDLSAPTKASADISKDGHTTTITLKGVEKGAGVPSSVTMNPEIASKATITQKKRDIVVAINTPKSMDVKDVKVFSLKKDTVNKKPYRIVVDLQKKGVAPKTNYYGAKPVALPTKPSTVKPYTTAGGLKGKVIALDAGHGGSDPGAIGPNGTQEKNITLPITKYLKADLEAMGAKVVMTRTTDVDVYAPNASGPDELQARVNVANYNNADAFVSVHINSFNNSSVGGIATYYYAKTSYDAKLAQTIQNRIKDEASFNGDRGIQPGNLYVLRHSSMPAVLVELGFISNPREEAALRTEATQKSFAQKIANGVAAYFGG